jgi:hypothetical protein
MLSLLTKWRRRISAIISINNTPDSPAKPPDDRTDQGGNYWTLFTPGIWKVLHAVLQSTPKGRPTSLPKTAALTKAQAEHKAWLKARGIKVTKNTLRT